jgi:uncharacterized protein YndB with AHSA1/START domain
MHKATIEIAATPEQVFTYMTDPKHVKSWQPDAVEVRPLPPGGLRVGAHVGATVQEYGRRFDIDMVVAELTPNEHIAYDMDAPTAAIHMDYRLVRWGDRTRLVSTAIVRPKGFLRPLFFLMKGMVQRKIESRLRLLRDVVEQPGPATGFSPTDRASASRAAPAGR